MTSKGSTGHACGCCRLPLQLPRRRWVVVGRALRRPRVVAVCDGCWSHLSQTRWSGVRVFESWVVVVLGGHFDERAKKMRKLLGEEPVAGVAE